MGLLANGNQYSLVGRFIGLTLLDGALPSSLPAAAARRNFNTGGGVPRVAGAPYGHLHPSAWVLPQVGGAMRSLQEEVRADFTVAGAGVLGLPGSGSSSFQIAALDAAGQLIISGEGVATLTFSAADALLTASVGTDGAATFSMTGSAAPGALASGVGAATFSLTGTLTPYAVGSMTGSTEAARGGADEIAASILARGIATAVVAAIDAAQPGVNVRKVNNVTLQGTGVPGDSMRPA